MLRNVDALRCSLKEWQMYNAVDGSEGKILDFDITQHTGHSYPVRRQRLISEGAIAPQEKYLIGCGLVLPHYSSNPCHPNSFNFRQTRSKSHNVPYKRLSESILAHLGDLKIRGLSSPPHPALAINFWRTLDFSRVPYHKVQKNIASAKCASEKQLAIF